MPEKSFKLVKVSGEYSRRATESTVLETVAVTNNLCGRLNALRLDPKSFHK